VNADTSAKLWTILDMTTRRAGRNRAGLWAAIILVAIAAPSLAQTPTLGEIARQEQERRKGLNGPTKVLTNDDLKNGGAPSSPAAGAAARPAADGAKPAASTGPAESKKPAPANKTDETSTATGPAASPPANEETWRTRMTHARDELRRNEVFAEALQSRINALMADFAARDNPIQRAQLADERQKALADLQRVRDDIERNKKQIAEIEEEARKAGVPPGWLR
jgi:hypothetical protein